MIRILNLLEIYSSWEVLYFRNHSREMQALCRFCSFFTRGTNFLNFCLLSCIPSPLGKEWYPGPSLSVANVAKCDKLKNLALNFLNWRKRVANTIFGRVVVLILFMMLATLNWYSIRMFYLAFLNTKNR